MYERGDPGSAKVFANERGVLCFRRDDDSSAPIAEVCLSLTSRCNANCVYCMEERDPLVPVDLSLEQALALARTFLGRVPLINSSASEALLHPRFLEFARAVTAGGSRVGVVTNGLAFARPGFLAACVDAGLRRVMVSVPTRVASTYEALTGTRRGFERLDHALSLLDEFNARADAERRVGVIVEIVLMRHLLREAAGLLAWLEAKLDSSAPLLRVETYRPLNSAAHRLDLQPSFDEVGDLVATFAEAHRRGARVEFRFVPLCLLPGLEHLAGEVGTVLRRGRTVGNHHVRDLALVEVAKPASALAQPLWRATCGQCPLALVCSGPYDVPMAPEGRRPAAPSLTLDEVAARLQPPLSREALAESLPLIVRDRCPPTGVDGGWADDELRAFAALAERLRGKPVTVELSPEVFVVAFPDAAQASGEGRIVATRARDEEAMHVRFGRVGVCFKGELSPRVEALVRAIGHALVENTASFRSDVTA